MQTHTNSCCSDSEETVDSSSDCCTIDQSEHQHTDEHFLEQKTTSTIRLFLPAIISFILLITGLLIEHFLHFSWFSKWIRFIWYLTAYIPVGIPVLKSAVESIKYSDFFSEFFLMSIATIGAFAIGEYPEGVAVMLFYTVGEIFQSLAVQRAKKNIKNLIDQRPEKITVVNNEESKQIYAKNANIGDLIQLKPGEKLALDGELISEKATFNTVALTGESIPATKRKGETVLAGMINLNTVALVKINTMYEDSKLSKILQLVQNASSQKAQTELFIRKFAKIYTPIVVFLALVICLLPYLFVDNYIFKEWLYKALIFLVISCPCALVISIPLGFFGGIGAGSRNGILFKGGNYLDILSTIQNVVLDKTGTMTEGVFKVQKVNIGNEFSEKDILNILNVVESKSTHPIASAIHEYVGNTHNQLSIEEVEEISGKGLRALIDGKEFLAGNAKLMEQFNIHYNIEDFEKSETFVLIALESKFAGYITISDKLKESSSNAIAQLKKLGVKTTMLSGDRTSIVLEISQKIGIENAYGDLLPEEKVDKVKQIKSQKETVAFVGDGINDAPVIAISDVGIAMGGLGSDAAIETADVVIQDDDPVKIATAIKIGRTTKKIVWQNIALAFGVKAIVLILGAGGLATMWEAVFADVGVALLAVFNAVRIQHINFPEK